MRGAYHRAAASKQGHFGDKSPLPQRLGRQGADETCRLPASAPCRLNNQVAPLCGDVAAERLWSGCFGVVVLVGMQLAGLFGVMFGLQMMPMGSKRMMRALLMVA